MASISRRNSHRDANAWPGWVDALSSLVMVVIFLLMVFVVAQFYLAATLTGRDEQLVALNRKVAEINDMLALERDANADLRVNIAQLSSELQSSVIRRDDMTLAMGKLQEDRDRAARTLDELQRAVRVDRESYELKLKEIISLQNDLKALREAREKLEGDLAAAAAIIRLAKEQQLSQTTELNASREQAKTLESQLAAALAAAKMTDGQRQALMADLDKANDRAKNLDSRLLAALAAAKLADEQRQSLTSDLTASRERAKSLDSQLAAALAAAKLADTQRQGLVAELDGARDRAKGLDSHLAANAAAAKLAEEQRQALLAELGSLRDRSKALETQLATAAERTMLAQKDIDQRDIRVKDLLSALAGEQAEGGKSRQQVEALNQQLLALRDQLARVAAILDASEKTSADQKVQIADLGSRLNQALAAKVQDLARYRSEFFGRVREALGSRPDVRVVGDRFVFQSELLFPSGSSNLEEGGKQRLAELAHTLIEVGKVIPSDINWVLRVDGHTDVRPVRLQLSSNWELSAARAISVVKYLIDQGIPAERLAATGFGEFQPLDQGVTDEAMARNRRIEIKLDQR
ncbi:peptidoglycan -binding protein [Azospirillum sp.]|uniref:peptidoglycan -binding protein n=1 Tax=Azospirillum sp. TaxID=34012 RepID=UPI002608E572|nr:peptidoglycan -binding protein [Azospirillum sp.]